MSEIATELQTSYEVEKNLMILNGYNAGTIEWEWIKVNKNRYLEDFMRYFILILCFGL